MTDESRVRIAPSISRIVITTFYAGSRERIRSAAIAVDDSSKRGTIFPVPTRYGPQMVNASRVCSPLGDEKRPGAPERPKKSTKAAYSERRASCSDKPGGPCFFSLSLAARLTLTRHFTPARKPFPCCTDSPNLYGSERSSFGASGHRSGSRRGEARSANKGAPEKCRTLKYFSWPQVK